jgi:hypothetical protein
MEALEAGAWGPQIGLGAEVAVFALILIPRLRFLGVLTAFALHFGLGTIGFRQFGIMFPLLLLFLRPPGPAPRVPPALRRVLPWLLPPAAVVFLRWNEHASGMDTLLLALFLLPGAVFAADVLRRVRVHGIREVGRPKLGLDRPGRAVLPALLAAWCLMPYLGITTHPCMTMYSHLSVHSGESNHYLVPASLQIDAIQSDLVRITSSSSPKRYPLGGKIPRLALRKQLTVDRMRGRAPKWVVWVEGDRELRASRGLLPNPSVLERLPMISFNGPSAMRDARATRSLNPAPFRGKTRRAD